MKKEVLLISSGDVLFEGREDCYSPRRPIYSCRGKTFFCILSAVFLLRYYSVIYSSLSVGDCYYRLKCFDV